MPRENWTRDELLLAFNLYCKLAFGKYHSGNSQVIKLATLIGRSPSAVAMKLSNFASLDPVHRDRGIRGLSNIGKADQEIWNEFHRDWTGLATESEIVLNRLTPQNTPESDLIETADMALYLGPTETQRTVMMRLGQQFFRTIILTSYQGKCCVCDIPIHSLLIASHIIPWHEREDLRVNPQNGLCLCVLHDKAFDTGLLGIDSSYNILISKEMNYPAASGEVSNAIRRSNP